MAQFYEKELVDKELWPLGEDLRERFEMTKQLLLKVQNHTDLLGGPESQLLRQKLALRGPYVTPLNVLQVHKAAILSIKQIIVVACNRLIWGGRRHKAFMKVG